MRLIPLNNLGLAPTYLTSIISSLSLLNPLSLNPLSSQLSLFNPLPSFHLPTTTVSIFSLRLSTFDPVTQTTIALARTQRSATHCLAYVHNTTFCLTTPFLFFPLVLVEINPSSCSAFPVTLLPSRLLLSVLPASPLGPTVSVSPLLGVLSGVSPPLL